MDDVFCLKRKLVDLCVDLRMDGVKYRTNLMEAAKDLRLDRQTQQQGDCLDLNIFMCLIRPILLIVQAA